MANYQGPEDRRRHLRVSPKGTVLVHADTYFVRGRIANLSRGGLSARTRTTAPERLLGCEADIDLRFDVQSASWLRMEGHLLRIGASSLTLRLGVVPPSFVRIMNETISASHQHDRMMAILLVDATSSRRRGMAEAFRAAGCAVVDVTTPLEAIVRLGESQFEPELIAIADSFPEAISDELRRFVDAEHPRAKLVTIGGAPTARSGLACWLSSADPGNDLAARIRKVLTTLGRR